MKKTCLLLSLHESINQTERNELVECVQTCLESPKKLVTQLQNIQLHTVFPLLNHFWIYDTIISQSVQIFSKLGIPIHTTAIAQLYHNSYHNLFLIGFRYYFKDIPRMLHTWFNNHFSCPGTVSTLLDMLSIQIKS